MTLAEFVAEQSARLELAGVCFGQGTTNAYDEAAWLVLHALGIAPDLFEDVTERRLTPRERVAAAALVDRRIATRQPAAYLTHEAWLQGVAFHVDARTIVPRSFIAELIADADGSGALAAWMSSATHRVLDLCTGNGSLAVLAALAWPDVTIDASDIDASALAVARINVDRHGLGARIALHQSDLFDAVEGRFDLIVCNPPYVNAHTMAELPPEFRAEPALALAGGTDGMDLVLRIVAGAAARLAEHGVLVLEIGNERENFERAFPRLETVWMPVSAGDDQVVLLTREALVR